MKAVTTIDDCTTLPPDLQHRVLSTTRRLRREPFINVFSDPAETRSYTVTFAYTSQSKPLGAWLNNEAQKSEIPASCIQMVLERLRGRPGSRVNGKTGYIITRRASSRGRNIAARHLGEADPQQSYLLTLAEHESLLPCRAPLRDAHIRLPATEMTDAFVRAAELPARLSGESVHVPYLAYRRITTGMDGIALQIDVPASAPLRRVSDIANAVLQESRRVPGVPDDRYSFAHITRHDPHGRALKATPDEIGVRYRKIKKSGAISDEAFRPFVDSDGEDADFTGDEELQIRAFKNAPSQTMIISEWYRE